MSRRLFVALIAALFLLVSAAPLPAWQGAPKQQPAKKAKKVWTNEDLAALPPGGISTSSAPAAPTSASADKPEADQKDKVDKDKGKEEDPVEKLRKQIEPLRTELDSVEARLRALRTVGDSGNTSGGGVDVSRTTGGVNTTAQIAQFEQRRSDLQRQIAAIEDEARRLGISPGAIR
jgi:hypothetical protein